MISKIIQLLKKESQNKDIYTTCYIDAYGPVDFIFQICDLPTLTDNEIILYCPIIFLEPDTTVTIYSSENGDVLWQDSQNSGQWELKLVGFYGLYTNPSYDEQLYVSLQGKALMVKITT